MSKRAFGNYFYSMEDSYAKKSDAQKAAKELRGKGYLVRVAETGWSRWADKWAVYIRRK